MNGFDDFDQGPQLDKKGPAWSWKLWQPENFEMSEFHASNNEKPSSCFGAAFSLWQILQALHPDRS